MSMFPHTVTVYNVSVETDPDTFEETTVNHITVLRGVLLAATKAINVRESGLEGADAVSLYIPFNVEAVDGETKEAKQYAGPVEFWRAERRDGLWTLSTGGDTFVVKGEAVEPGASFERISLTYDGVYTVTKVDERDFGSPALQHWEVGGA